MGAKGESIMKLGSLFDGSGGFPLAGVMNGFEPLWASEVEPYPIAVTRSRFPQMLHLGNVCDVSGATVRPVDVVTFGSPCQDLSVAGKRAGLKHEDHGDDETTRSGLFMEAVRIITEMREATNGRYPTFSVWENVPGAMSSSGGDDFLAVLENLAKIADPEVSIPKPDKWCANGEIVGNGWSIAWRIIDARHFGVTVRDGDKGDVLVRGTPQRRRRIYLVADFRGARAGKILFECAGVSGDSEPCAETRKGNSADAEGSVGDAVGTVKAYGIDHVITTGGNCTAQGPCVYEDIEATLKASGTHAVCYGISAYESNAMKSSNPHSGIYEADTSRTIDLNGGNPACNQGGIAVVETAAGFLDRNSADARSIGYEDEEAPTIRESMTPSVVCSLFENHSQDTRFNGPQGDGVNDDVSFTCNTTDRHAVAYEMKAFGKYEESSLASSLKARDYKDSTDLICSSGDVAGTLDASYYKGCGERQGVERDYVVAAVDCRNGTEDPDINGTLQAKPSGGTSLNLNNVVRKNYLVRRLTPTECARLQGFPDTWGHPDIKTEFTDEEYTFWQTVRDTHAEINSKPQKTYTREQMLNWYNKLHTDSAEYKMWGNGIALPCAHFVLNRIAKEIDKVRTLDSWEDRS
jgi:DNA (cytosine-5)-methyltransferase 1